ncbi:MAG: signal peptidase I [Bdellovibrionota bacterium]
MRLSIFLLITITIFLLGCPEEDSCKDKIQKGVKILVNGSSMKPTFLSGKSYPFHIGPFACLKPQVNEIVAFEHSKTRYVKRIAAVPGDKIWLNQQHHLVVNGTLLKDKWKQPYAYSQDSWQFVSKQLIDGRVIPSGRYLLTTDYALGGSDSRIFGLINFFTIKGIYRPFD